MIRPPMRVWLPVMLVAGGLLGATVNSPAASTTPPPAADCLMGINQNGDASWYCGRTVRIPKDLLVQAPTMPTCTSDDGSGPVPCYWAADERGNRIGRSFTRLRMGGRILVRFNDGVTVVERQ